MGVFDFFGKDWILLKNVTENEDSILSFFTQDLKERESKLKNKEKTDKYEVFLENILIVMEYFSAKTNVTRN